MSAPAATVTDRVRGAWEYYRRYTLQRTGVHAGATAALTVLGLLAYYERWFVVIAIVAYFVPPVYLYLSGDDLSEPDSRPTEFEPAPTSDDHAASAARTVVDADADFDGYDADADGDDADFDGYDADSDGYDADSDGDGGDIDSDADG